MNQNILKGIFILLVVVDHNDFSRSLFPGFLEGLGFHVMGFMMVPFLRPAPRWDHEFGQYLFRLYYPFFLIVTALSVVVAVVTPVGTAEQAGRWLLALYSGHSGILKETTHMALLWFLPSFLSLVLMRTLIECSGSVLRILAIAALWLAHPLIGALAPAVRDYLPLGLLPALYVLPLAYLGIAVHRALFEPLGRWSAVLLSTFLFAAAKAGQMHFGFENEIGFSAVADYRAPLALLFNDAEAVLGVLMAFQASRLPLGRLVEACGKVSLQVYLLHAFVALLVYKALSWLALGTSPLLSFLLSYAATVLLTLPLARLAAEQPIRRLLFPRSLQELGQAWKRRPLTAAAPSNTPADRRPSL